MLVALALWLLDPQMALAQLSKTDWRWLLPALLIVQVQVALSALRWKLTANRLGQALGMRRAIAEYYLATVGNLSLPGGVTGDAARVYRNNHPQALGVAVHGVLLERLSGQLALLVVSVFGWLLWPWLMQAHVPGLGMRVLSVAFALLVLLTVLCIMVERFAPKRVGDKIRELGLATRRAWLADRQWIVQSVLSLGVVFTYMLVFLLSSYAVGAPLPLPAVVSIVPLVLLSMVIPLSVGGWGIREAAAAILWPFVGLSAESGVITSVVYALVSLLGCLPGLILLFSVHRK